MRNTHTSNRFKPERFINQRYGKDSWTFQVVIRIPGHDTITKSFSEKKYGSARRAYDEAIRFRNKKVVDIENGTVERRSSVTLEEVFYESFAVLPVRDETKRKHIILFNKYIGHNDTPVRDIKRSMIMDSLNKMITCASDDTIARVLSIWKRTVKTAIIKEYLVADVTAGVIAPHSQMIPKPKRKVITDRHTLDVVESLIAQKFCEEETQSVCTALELMWYTGLRPAECFALSPDDVKDGYVDVNKELGTEMADSTDYCETGKKNSIRKCKTKASVRKVPMPKKLIDIMSTYNGAYEDVLFPDKYGQHFDVNYLGSRIHSLGVEFNMYQLRHTVSTKLVTSGVDQRTIVEILGHENFNMSVYYARSNDELKKDALDLIH